MVSNCLLIRVGRCSKTVLLFVQVGGVPGGQQNPRPPGPLRALSLALLLQRGDEGAARGRLGAVPQVEQVEVGLGIVHAGRGVLRGGPGGGGGDGWVKVLTVAVLQVQRHGRGGNEVPR